MKNIIESGNLKFDESYSILFDTVVENKSNFDSEDFLSNLECFEEFRREDLEPLQKRLKGIFSQYNVDEKKLNSIMNTYKVLIDNAILQKDVDLAFDHLFVIGEEIDTKINELKVSIKQNLIRENLIASPVFRTGIWLESESENSVNWSSHLFYN